MYYKSSKTLPTTTSNASKLQHEEKREKEEHKNSFIPVFLLLIGMYPMYDLRNEMKLHQKKGINDKIFHENGKVYIVTIP